MMRRTAIMLASFVILLTLGAATQESRSEISLQGTGFFPKDSNGQGISRTATDTGGFLVGYLCSCKPSFQNSRVESLGSWRRWQFGGSALQAQMKLAV